MKFTIVFLILFVHLGISLVHALEAKDHLPTDGDKIFEGGRFHEDALANELARHRRALEIISSFKGEITEDMPSGHTQIVWNPRALPRLQKVKTDDYSTGIGEDEDDDEDAEEGEETKVTCNKMPDRPQSDNKSWCYNPNKERRCVPQLDNTQTSKTEKKEWMAMFALQKLAIVVKGKNSDGDSQY
ncbi:hypothetical protein FHETE_2770 [Fusarium heterosporum]|uniref:Uncharacterized protein n=1 Tax=Fusarium heterosporum TaxID=42747 RepID=A0A8H5WYU8_FUSHE|nr:hypothetical protein FHETE_2770 [Fusarium heterosporum]